MFTTCTHEYYANLSGKKLGVKGMPYVQQDTNVCVCAEAALWMMAHYMHQKHHYPRFKPSQITQMATQFSIVGPVREGLVPNQVLAAMREMGYAPLKFTHIDTQETAKIIYSYIESEIPVILAIIDNNRGHAVTVIGHNFNTFKRPKRKWNSNINWIDRFYIQNDAVGPCRDLTIDKKLKNTYSIKRHAAFIFVPAPPDVSMQANDVFDRIEELIPRLNDLMDSIRPNNPFRFTQTEVKNLVFRTYLRLSNEFKEQLPIGMSRYFQHLYRSMRMPRYVWVTEISYANLLNNTNSSQRKIIGEIIIDSTADWTSRRPYLTIHLLGRMIVKVPEHENPSRLFVDPSETPYSHLVR
jgi:hypothetical protein